MEKSILASLGYHPTLQVPNYQNLEVEKETTSRIMDAVDKVPDDAVYETMSIGGKDEVEEKIEDLAKAGLKHFVFGDLLAPRSVRKTLAKLSHIIKRYK